MSSLHTLSNPSRIEHCLLALNAKDELLLLDDGIYLAISNKDLLPPYTFGIRADAELRGLTSRIPNSLTLIEFSDFVQMCTKHDRVVNWF